MQIQIDLRLPLHTALEKICRKCGNINRPKHRTIQLLASPLQLLLPVFFLQKISFHTRSCNLHHIDLRTDVGKYTLHMSQSPGKHGKTVGHNNFVFLHHIH